MSQFLRVALVPRLRYLTEQVSSFETFHAGNARLSLNSFCTIFTQDDVLAIVWEALRGHLDTSPKEWHEQANASGTLPPMPTSAAACMAFRFAVFRFMRMQKVDLQNFTTTFYPGAHLNERLMNWKRAFVHPFAADCRTLAADLLERMPQTEWVDWGVLVESYLRDDFQGRGFGPRSWTDSDDEAAETAALPRRTPAARVEDPVLLAIDDLEAALLRLEARAQSDTAKDVAALRLERERPTFVRERFLARLDDVAEVAELAPSCKAVRRCLDAS